MSNALIYAALTLFGIALIAPGAFAEGRRGGPPPEVVEKWDADGDGKLSRAERSAARDAGDLRERR